MASKNISGVYLKNLSPSVNQHYLSDLIIMATAFVEKEALYVIQHKKSQAIKIGITKDWPSRAKPT